MGATNSSTKEDDKGEKEKELSHSENRIAPMRNVTAKGKRADILAPDVVDAGRPNPSTISDSAYKQYKDSLNDIRAEADNIAEIAYEEYEYPFENLVFEGGGAKGQVYIGCLQVIEELGIKPKRISGASAGAICAGLLAAGYNSAELAEILRTDLDTVLIDHRCGICSLLPNLISDYGWNPGNKFMKIFGGYLANKLGKPNITFKELYRMTGVELCVTAVNLNMLSVEYFHPKTSPNMSVCLAVRMSLSIPGIFQAVKLKNSNGQIDVYIDGGVLCNYPIHAFDGWWLSMKKEDSFLNRLQPLSQIHKLMDKKKRFGEHNEKTVGFLVYSSLEQDLMQSELDSRVGVEILERPPTSKLYKDRAEAIESKKQALEEHQVFLSALDKFLKSLRHVNDDQMAPTTDDVIDKQELKQTLQEAMKNKMVADVVGAAASCVDDSDTLTADHIEILFGTNADLDAIFNELDVDDSGYISYDELLLFIERSGIDIQAKFQGYDRKELASLGDFVVGLQDCLLTNVKKMFLEERDIHRTVGVNTDYINTTDFRMEDVDREFCYEQGRKATIAFLKHYVHEHKPKKKVQTTGPIASYGLPQLRSQQLTAVHSSMNGGRLPSGSDAPLADDPFAYEPATPSLRAGERTDGTAVLPPIRGVHLPPLARSSNTHQPITTDSLTNVGVSTQVHGGSSSDEL